MEMSVTEAQSELVAAQQRVARAWDALDRALRAAARPAWAPMGGAILGPALEPGSEHAIGLASALEVVRRRVCAYSDGTIDARCDCKYGVGEVLTEGASIAPHGEKNGCPELRDVVTFLLGGED